MRSRGKVIETLLASKEWARARRAIERELRLAPDDHWLISRLALTRYEQREYAKAHELETRALRLAPRCPLVLWGYAGSLEMLGRKAEAVVVYRRLIRRGPDRLSRGPCGEGIRWARGLVADCWYRLGRISQAEGKPRLATREYRNHLDARRGGASVYDVSEVRVRLRSLERGRD